VLAAGEQLSAAIAEQRYRNTSLIGPVPCFYHKRAGVYRWQLIIRSADPRKLLDAHPLTSWQPAGLSVDYNLDPINLL
jgi:primosomal protein N'